MAFDDEVKGQADHLLARILYLTITGTFDMTDNDTMGAWAKYAWAIVIGAFILLVCSAIAAFILTPKLGMSAMFIPLCMGVIILGFVLFNGDKFRRV